MCQKANKSTSRRLSILDIAAFENVLNVDILVVSSTVGIKFIRTVKYFEDEGRNSNGRQRIFMYHSKINKNAHFDTIINIRGLFAHPNFVIDV